MSDNLIICIVEDEWAPERSPCSPVGWLETAFTFQWATGAFHDDRLVPGPADIRPMIEIIDQEEDSAEDDHGPMVIGQADYDDPGRWWL